VTFSGRNFLPFVVLQPWLETSYGAALFLGACNSASADSSNITNIRTVVIIRAFLSQAFVESSWISHRSVFLLRSHIPALAAVCRTPGF